jgi:glutaconate CoA-transferase subunit A
MSARQLDLADAVALVRDGDLVGIGGAVLSRKPIAAVQALIAAGRRDLEIITFTGSLDVELLVAAGAVRAVRSSSVGLGPLGPARHFTEAVEAGRIEDLEESEWMLLGSLRAAAAGMPFLPTRAGLGSELVARRGLREVADPYTGERLLAVPALIPDVAIIHGWRADARGNVQAPWPPDHLFDIDPLLARAARTTIVTVEEIVDPVVLAATSERTVLFSFEVDAIVEAPRGAAPTASPPSFAADHAAIASMVSAMIGNGNGRGADVGADRERVR